MPPGLNTGWPAHGAPDRPPMAAPRSAWSMRFGTHLCVLGVDVMPLEAVKIGATRYEQLGHLNPEDAAVLYAAEHQPGHRRSNA